MSAISTRAVTIAATLLMSSALAYAQFSRAPNGEPAEVAQQIIQDNFPSDSAGCRRATPRRRHDNSDMQQR